MRDSVLLGPTTKRRIPGLENRRMPCMTRYASCLVPRSSLQTKRSNKAQKAMIGQQYDYISVLPRIKYVSDPTVLQSQGYSDFLCFSIRR